MFILSCISKWLELSFGKHSSLCENFESKLFIKLFGEMFNNQPRNLLGKLYTKLLNLVDNHCCQYYNGLILLQ